jgi:hypothetical protein
MSARATFCPRAARLDSGECVRSAVFAGAGGFPSLLGPTTAGGVELADSALEAAGCEDATFAELSAFADDPAFGEAETGDPDDEDEEEAGAEDEASSFFAFGFALGFAPEAELSALSAPPAAAPEVCPACEFASEAGFKPL